MADPEERIYEIVFPMFGKIEIETPLRLNEFEFYRLRDENYLKIHELAANPLEIRYKAIEKASGFIDFISYLTREGLSLGTPRIHQIGEGAPRVQFQEVGFRAILDRLDPFIAEFFPKFERLKPDFDPKYINALRWFRIGCASDGVDSFLTFFIAFEMIISSDREKGFVKSVTDFYDHLKTEFRQLGYNEEQFRNYFHLFLYGDFKKEIEILHGLRNKIVHTGLRAVTTENRQTFELEYKKGKKVQINLTFKIREIKEILISLFNFYFRQIFLKIQEEFPVFSDLIGSRDIAYDKFFRIKEKFPTKGYDQLRLLCYPFLAPSERIEEIYRWIDFDEENRQEAEVKGEK